MSHTPTIYDTAREGVYKALRDAMAGVLVVDADPAAVASDAIQRAQAALDAFARCEREAAEKAVNDALPLRLTDHSIAPSDT